MTRDTASPDPEWDAVDEHTGGAFRDTAEERGTPAEPSGALLDAIEAQVNESSLGPLWLSGAHYVLRSIRRGSPRPLAATPPERSDHG